MKNLITGGVGFIGSHLGEYLLAHGEEVGFLDDLSTGNFNNIKKLVNARGFKYYIGKVEDEKLLEKALGDSTRIFHFTAANE